MFKKNHVKKYFVVDTHRNLSLFMCILLRGIFARKSGRINVGERYFTEWIIKEGRLVND